MSEGILGQLRQVGMAISSVELGEVAHQALTDAGLKVDATALKWHIDQDKEGFINAVVAVMDAQMRSDPQGTIALLAQQLGVDLDSE